MSTDDRYIDSRRMDVTKVKTIGDRSVLVEASTSPTRPGAPRSVIQYVTSADRAPRVGIVVNVTIEVIR